MGRKKQAPLVTGCADRHLRVGDRIRAQVCVGRYGQTATGEGVVDKDHYPLGVIQVAITGAVWQPAPKHSGAVFRYCFKTGRLIGAYTHGDYEHGHETWVEVIDPKETA